MTSGDFEVVFKDIPEEAFLFIAPPYSIHHSLAQNRLHKYPFERADHFRLANALKLLDKRVKFLVTYNDNKELREMYSWATNSDLTVTLTCGSLHPNPASQDFVKSRC